jgi:hypothetical protein
MAEYDFEVFDIKNAQTLIELITDPDTSDATRIQILNKLSEAKVEENFFRAMLEQMLSWGACPHCQHENHWLIPENTLNEMGEVTYQRDPRVKANTTAKDCPTFQESCGKKKVNY